MPMKKPINYIFVKIRNDQEEMKMAKKESNLASVLSFEKKLVLSDGYMYGTTWEKRNETARPVMLVEKSVRGTISNRLKDSVKMIL